MPWIDELDKLDMDQIDLDHQDRKPSLISDNWAARKTRHQSATALLCKSSVCVHRRRNRGARGAMPPTLFKIFFWLKSSFFLQSQKNETIHYGQRSTKLLRFVLGVVGVGLSAKWDPSFPAPPHTHFSRRSYAHDSPAEQGILILKVAVSFPPHFSMWFCTFYISSVCAFDI